MSLAIEIRILRRILELEPAIEGVSVKSHLTFQVDGEWIDGKTWHSCLLNLHRQGLLTRWVDNKTKRCLQPYQKYVTTYATTPKGRALLKELGI